MRKRKKLIIIIAFLLLISLFPLLLNDALWHEKDKKIYNISIITRGKNSESLLIMKQGIDQAASEMNVNTSFVTLSEDNSIDEQSQLIEREIKNNADAIIISPVDFEKMTNPIENAMKKVPVILFESTVDSKHVEPSISCDNYNLGVNLGKEVIKNGKMCSNIAIIKNNLDCSSIKERYDGFMSVMENTKNNYIFWELKDEKQQTYYNQGKNLLEDNNVDVVVTFDTGILEGISEAKKDLISTNKEKAAIEVYGAGSTNKIISLLEDKTIKATAIQNEFNVGYLSIKSAVNRIKGESMDSSNISSTVVNRDNMYSEENQRLLFPFIR
ncbi:substrate-binding domain-containing protein [uncultured Clostridium sp.]|uniref:substrate-binding domain-containing protein n=1 Tax=uncultured Clostridium sp. TaxID=59620 RepID=UPI0028ECEC14|nr:substrate-binding domain-containing protein [uncultured Clostridium sp.]